MVSANAVSTDVSSTIASDSVVGTLNRGVVNLTPTMTWLGVIIWLAYVVPTWVLFFWVTGPRANLPRRALRPRLQRLPSWTLLGENRAGVGSLCTGRLEARSAYLYTLTLNVVWPTRGVA